MIFSHWRSRLRCAAVDRSSLFCAHPLGRDTGCISREMRRRCSRVYPVLRTRSICFTPVRNASRIATCSSSRVVCTSCCARACAAIASSSGSMTGAYRRWPTPLGIWSAASGEGLGDAADESRMLGVRLIAISLTPYGRARRGISAHLVSASTSSMLIIKSPGAVSQGMKPYCLAKALRFSRPLSLGSSLVRNRLAPCC